ncbi:MAG: radical SAM protein [Candidatus Omnitrophota bacterium]|nr:radical SAM protein [Candidatus Omnitrophota bacterium]
MPIRRIANLAYNLCALKRIKKWLIILRHGITFKKLINAIHVYYEFWLGKTELESQPLELRVEPSNICNLHCINCHTGKNEPSGREKSYLKFEDFKKIFDQLKDRLLLLQLIGWGESFLNKDTLRMSHYAKENRVATIIHTSGNFHLNDELLNEIFTSELTVLSFSIDGASQESYTKYRAGGNFDLALENAKKIIARKKKLRSSLPHIIWQFLVFYFNVHEVKEAERISKNLGFDDFISFRGDLDASHGQKIDFDTRERLFLPLELRRCRFLWDTLCIAVDGGISACCCGYKKADDFGNIKDYPFVKDAWNSKYFRDSRAMFSKKEQQKKIDYHNFCSNCFFFQSSP